VREQVEGKQPVDICPPIAFSGDDESTWSPEDFFVAAAASCLAVTFTGIAQRACLDYDDLTVDADGVCGQRPTDASVSRVSGFDSNSRPTKTRQRRESLPSAQRKPVSWRHPWTSQSRRRS
jgi:organic hydroperoxide reductase OsmC/OhrA